MLNLSEKSTIITGGASGIGFAIANLFARQGAAVELFDIDREAIDRSVAEIRKAGGSAQGMICDVADPDSVEFSVSMVRKRHGRIDLLVNNAGVAHVGNAVTTSAADFERIQRINISGVANCLRFVLPCMVEAGGGAVVNMCSTVALHGISDRFAYSASKGAVLAMTYSVARDFLAHRIRCNAILPGRVHTPFVDGFIAKNYPGQEAAMFEKLSKAVPLGRMAQPDEIANAALFLCSDEAAFITGTAMPVDGGTISIR